jgi:hypothetical protein
MKEETLRGPLVVLELAALVMILGLVEDVPLRVGLGLLVGLLLARAALMNRETARRGSAAPGDRRSDHLYRHWINAMLKKVRELHMVCQGVRSGGVNVAVGELRIAELEKEIRDLLNQVTESAKPREMKGARPTRRWRTRERSARPGVYGESVDLR